MLNTPNYTKFSRKAAKFRENLVRFGVCGGLFSLSRKVKTRVCKTSMGCLFVPLRAFCHVTSLGKSAVLLWFNLLVYVFSSGGKRKQIFEALVKTKHFGYAFILAPVVMR